MNVTDELASYISGAVKIDLPTAVVERSGLHVLDTLAACRSGAGLAAGEAVRALLMAGTSEGPCHVVGTRAQTSAEIASLANAMCAHADETDDSHERSRTHPGSSIVPASLAVAEEEGASGAEFLRAVVLGYDVCTRVNMSLWSRFGDLRADTRDTHAIGAVFGCAAAAAALMRLDMEQVASALSFAAQQAAGLRTWERDTEHIEKAFVFAGMPARNGVFSARVASLGWPGVRDVFDGEPSVLNALGVHPDSARLVDGLGARFEILNTNIKRYPVGSPAQAPVQATIGALRASGWASGDVQEVLVRLPSNLARVVESSRRMANINLAYLLAVTLDDGDLSFVAAHDDERFASWRVAGGDSRVVIRPDDSLESVRQAYVTLVAADGRTFEHGVPFVKGSPLDPMTLKDVTEKVHDLLDPAMGAGRVGSLIEMTTQIYDATSVRNLATEIACGSSTDGSFG